MAIRAKYVGDGTGYFSGIPMRHLEQEEYEALTTEQRATLRGSDVYEVLSDREYADLTREGRRARRTPSAPVDAIEESEPLEESELVAEDAAPTEDAPDVTGQDDGRQPDA